MSNISIPEILERKYALYVILCVKEMPGSTKSEIIKLDPRNERTKFLRIKELIDAGIIKVDDVQRQHNAMKLYLTEKGQVMANYLEKMINAYNEE